MIIIVAFVRAAALATGGYVWSKRRECPPPRRPAGHDPSKENFFFERFLPKPTSGHGEPL